MNTELKRRIKYIIKNYTVMHDRYDDNFYIMDNNYKTVIDATRHNLTCFGKKCGKKTSYRLTIDGGNITNGQSAIWRTMRRKFYAQNGTTPLVASIKQRVSAIGNKLKDRAEAHKILNARQRAIEARALESLQKMK